MFLLALYFCAFSAAVAFPVPESYLTELSENLNNLEKDAASNFEKTISSIGELRQLLASLSDERAGELTEEEVWEKEEYEIAEEAKVEADEYEIAEEAKVAADEYEASAEAEDEMIAQYYREQEYPREEPGEEVLGEEESIASSDEDISEMLSELEELVVEEQDRSRDVTPQEELPRDEVVLEESLGGQLLVQEIGEEKIGEEDIGEDEIGEEDIGEEEIGEVEKQDAAADEYLRSLGLD